MTKKQTPEATQDTILSTTERIEDSTQIAVREIKEVRKDISSMDGDRQLMETHQSTLTEAKELLRLTRQRIDDSERSIKFEINELDLRMERLEKIVKEINEKLDTKKIVPVKEKKKPWRERIKFWRWFN